MVFNHFYLVYIIVPLCIGPPFHGYPSLEHFIFFWYPCRSCGRFAGAFLVVFHDKMSLHFESFLRAIPAFNAPHPCGVSLGPGLTPQNRLDCRVNLSIQAC